MADNVLRRAARRFRIIQVIVPALFLLIPLSMVWGLVTQGRAHGDERTMVATVTQVEKNNPGDDTDRSYDLTVRLPNGESGSVQQERAASTGDRLTVFVAPDGTGIRSRYTNDAKSTLIGAGVMFLLFGTALYGGVRFYRRDRAGVAPRFRPADLPG